ncbi:hypothetical protein BB561_005662 [Smittium simulii]|uniref:Uncharacterized protein n=1 Tax=Smittium simulii TaxID=133385 RepID=A0A2T9Y963_9FUNG|nr:hypothetical protein BB561_005662 [Smittium simulii]
MQLKKNLPLAFSTLNHPLTNKLHSIESKNGTVKSLNTRKVEVAIWKQKVVSKHPTASFFQKIRLRTILFICNTGFSSILKPINYSKSPLKGFLFYPKFNITKQLLKPRGAYVGATLRFLNQTSFSTKRIAIANNTFYDLIQLDYKVSRLKHYKRLFKQSNTFLNLSLKRMSLLNYLKSYNSKIFTVKANSNHFDFGNIKNWSFKQLNTDFSYFNDYINYAITKKSNHKAYTTTLPKVHDLFFSFYGLQALHNFVVTKASEFNFFLHSTTISLKQKGLKKIKNIKKSLIIKPVLKLKYSIATLPYSQILPGITKKTHQIWSNNEEIPADRTIMVVDFNIDFKKIVLSTPAENTHLQSQDFNAFMEQIQSAQIKRNLHLSRMFEILSKSSLDLVYVNTLAQNSSITIVFNSLSEAPNASTITDMLMNWGIILDEVFVNVCDPITLNSNKKNSTFQTFHDNDADRLGYHNSNLAQDLSTSTFKLCSPLDSSMCSLLLEEVDDPSVLHNYEINNFLNKLDCIKKPTFAPFFIDFQSAISTELLLTGIKQLLILCQTPRSDQANQ